MSLKFFLIATVLISAMAYAGDDGDPPSHIEDSMEDLVYYHSSFDEVWPGYWPENLAFALFDKKGRTLIARKNCDLPSLKPYKKERDLWFCTYLYNTGMERLPFVTTLVIDGEEIPAARQRYKSEQSYAKFDLLWRRAVDFVATWQHPEGKAVGTWPKLSVGLLASLYSEKQVLTSTLRQFSEEDRETGLLSYLAARIERQNTMNAEETRRQSVIERTQSVTGWMASHAYRKMYRSASNVQNDNLVATMQSDFGPWSDSSKHFRLNELYLHGWALLELMEHQGIPFREALQAGYSQIDVLTYVYPLAAGARKSILNQVFGEKERRDARQRAEMAIDALRDSDKWISKYNKSAKYELLLLDLSHVAIDMDPFHRTVLDDGSFLFRKKAKTVVDSEAVLGNINANWQRYYPEQPNGETNSLNVALDIMPRISGCEYESELVCAEGTIIEAEDVMLRAIRPVQIEISVVGSL